MRSSEVVDAPARSDGAHLRRLGKVLHVSKSRALIVKLDPPKFVKPGTKTCDSRLKSIGTVGDVLGPVSGPYASIRPSILKPESVVGRILYAIDD